MNYIEKLVSICFIFCMLFFAVFEAPMKITYEADAILIFFVVLKAAIEGLIKIKHEFVFLALEY